MRQVIRADDPIRGLINFYSSDGQLSETIRQEQMMSDTYLLQNTLARLQYGESQ